MKIKSENNGKGVEIMERPCGGLECARFVERCGGDPESPSEYICRGCGADGPMFWYYSQNAEDDDSREE